MRTLPILLMLQIAACGSDAPPSCQQALAHYYAAGCTYKDLATGQPISQDQITGSCQQAAATAPAQCLDELDAWLECNDKVPTPSTTNAQCDCSQTQMAFLACR